MPISGESPAALLWSTPQLTWHTCTEGVKVWAWWNRTWREGIVSQMRNLRRDGCRVILEHANGAKREHRIKYSELRYRK